MNIINEITVTGTLVDASKLTTGIFKKGNSIGKQYISGEVSVKCVLDGKENIIPISLFSSEVTQKGEHSKLFDSYSSLPAQVGQRITFAGCSLEEHCFVRNGEVARRQRIRGRFINNARNGEPDAATFRLNGYVARGLEEKTNKKGEVYLLELVLGQANYRGDAAQMFYLNLPLDEIERKNVMQKAYVPGVTVSVEGDIRYLTEQRELVVESGESLFGEPMKKIVVNTYTYYYIRHASAPMQPGSPDAYTMENMQSFKEARNAEQTRLISEAQASGDVTDESVPLNNKAASLL